MTPPGAAPPPEVTDIAVRVRRRLDEVLAVERARWSKVDTDLALPLDAVARLVLGSGKRLRPAFCHWGFVAAGGDPGDDRVVDVGAAFELLHAFALMHDDVMDGSATRRGEPTIHIEFADRHADQGWRGEARRFGEGVAILAGDLAEVFADRLMSASPPAAIAVWEELKIEVNIGQYLDVLGTARGGTDFETARRISRYKSGKYTIERPLHVGAALAGRLDDLQGALSDYGAPLGEAFQLRDDILGVFGDRAVTGKPVGDDLREGKPTPLLAVAVERCRGDDAELLTRVGAPDLGDDEVAALQALLESCGAREVVEVTIGELTDTAVNHIGQAPVPPEASDALIALAHYVAARDS